MRSKRTLHVEMTQGHIDEAVKEYLQRMRYIPMSAYVTKITYGEAKKTSKLANTLQGKNFSKDPARKLTLEIMS